MLNIIYINASFKRLTVLTVNSFIFATPSFFKHTHYIYYYIYIYLYIYIIKISFKFYTLPEKNC